MNKPCPLPLLPAHDEQRWLLPCSLPARVSGDAPWSGTSDLPVELLAVLWRRGHRDPAAIEVLLSPPEAPDPREHFPDLVRAEQRLVQACRQGETVAICGDYDADGMTSTALLAGVLQRLGAIAMPAIPSRMAEGYGLNVAMVERLAAAGVRLLITVDNGVAAKEALDRARELDLEVILTDHHTLPAELPPHLALLHPAVTPEGSPFRGLAGVGLAHVLASGLCRRLKRQDGLAIALDLFCIGTIADMAPLTGVNRRWLMEGLPRLGSSSLPGLKALQQIAGIEQRPLDAETVGFQLAPRINAVGRLGDPLLVVDLLTTEDREQALALAAAQDKKQEEYEKFARLAYAEIKDYSVKKTPLGAAALAFILSNRLAAFDTFNFQVEILSDQLAMLGTRATTQSVALAYATINAGRTGWPSAAPAADQPKVQKINEVFEKALLAQIEPAVQRATAALDAVKLKLALETAMTLAHETNRYLNAKEPWQQIKTDPAAAATSIFVALRVIDTLKTLFAPFLPFTCQKLHAYLGYDGDLFGRLYT
ncbi:MAG: DHH family phosphoesterase, partial [Synechococcaceae cyanobacterium ELA182]